MLHIQIMKIARFGGENYTDTKKVGGVHRGERQAHHCTARPAQFHMRSTRAPQRAGWAATVECVHVQFSGKLDCFPRGGKK
eukprot:gene11894-biopygen13971